jgi:NAD(P)-dependent dehydrogenase (short-subunit alcohol dehydrogenase family)
VRLAGRVAIVTGAAKGLGKAIAFEFLREGATVVLVDRDSSSLDKTQKELDKMYRNNAVAIVTDITKKRQVREMVQKTLKQLKKIDILINNAGIVAKNWVIDLTEEVWNKVMDTNIKSVYLCSQAVLPHMIQRHYGRIVNISSIAGKQGEAAGGAYAASKFGVIGFTQALALEVGKYNILVNAVCPGLVLTDLGQSGVNDDAKLRGISREEHLNWFIDRTPLGYLGTPLQVAKMCAFVASEDCDFTTGFAFDVSGGFIMH